jgi:hypothetical protein
MDVFIGPQTAMLAANAAMTLLFELFRDPEVISHHHQRIWSCGRRTEDQEIDGVT